MNALPPVPALVGDGWRDAWRTRVDQLEPWLVRWIEEQHDSAYWRQGSVRPAYDRIGCPVFLVGGWADGYRNNTFRTVTALAAQGTPHRLLLGPWSHMSTATSLPGPHLDLVPVMARWWDRWLRGIDEGYDDQPALTWFAQRSTRPGADRALVDGEWRSAPAWPLAGARDDAPRAGRRRGGPTRCCPTSARRPGTAARVAAVGPADRPALRRRGVADLGVAGRGDVAARAPEGCGSGSGPASRWRTCRPSCATSSPTARRRC